MKFISRKRISCKSLFYVIFLCLWLCESDGVKSGFKIYRSEHDIFTNLKCISDSISDNCTESQCEMYDAECYSSSNCKYCRCSAEGKSTFMISDDTGMDGECKRDEEIVPESGCYRFSDGSFMKYLNYGTTNPKLHISAPIFKENNENCKVKKKFKFSPDGQEWRDGDRDISLTIYISKKKELKIESMDNLKAWSGSLLKLVVSCKKKRLLKLPKERYCVLIKLQSLPPYSEVGEGLKASGSVGINSTAIAVTVTLLPVALALALGFLFYYRRRKSAQVPEGKNIDLGVVNYPNDIYEDPDRIYETVKEEGDDVPPNEQGTTPDSFCFPDSSTSISNPSSTEQEYTYAKDTNSPRSNVSTRAASDKRIRIRNGVVYQNSYQLGQQTDDDFCNYPENINIANQPSSELEECTCAKDTDDPRATAYREAMPQEPASNAVYHILEQKQPPSTDLYKLPGAHIPTELEYAKDTGIPRVTADTKTMPEEPSSNTVLNTSEHESPTTDLYKLPGTIIPTELECTYAKDTDISRATADTETVPEEPSSNTVLNNSEHESPTTDLYKLPGTIIPTELECTYAKDTNSPRVASDKETVPEEPAM